MKRKLTKKRKTGTRNEDAKQRRKYEHGGRIEAYTFGEMSSKKNKNWPY